MTPVLVIVDEGIGPNTATWDQFQRIPGERPAEYLFLAEAHPDIPHIGILDKLLTTDPCDHRPFAEFGH